MSAYLDWGPANETQAEARLLVGCSARAAMAAARPRRPDPDLRVPLFCPSWADRSVQQPVIRELGVVVVDADRSDTSRAFVSRSRRPRSQHRRARRPTRVGSARDPLRRGHRRRLRAGRFRARSQGRAPPAVVALQPAIPHRRGIASSGLSDSLAPRQARGGPRRARPSRIGSLVARRSCWSTRQRNYAQFCSARCCRWVSTSSSPSPPATGRLRVSAAAACASASCAGGNPIARWPQARALFAIFFVIMLTYR